MMKTTGDLGGMQRAFDKAQELERRIETQLRDLMVDAQASGKQAVVELGHELVRIGHRLESVVPEEQRKALRRRSSAKRTPARP